VTAIVIFCITTYFFLDGIRKLWSQQEQVFDNNNGEVKNAKKEEILNTKKPRLKSLDVFRGWALKIFGFSGEV
jgi:hypothetical protein